VKPPTKAEIRRYSPGREIGRGVCTNGGENVDLGWYCDSWRPYTEEAESSSKMLVCQSCGRQSPYCPDVPVQKCACGYFLRNEKSSMTWVHRVDERLEKLETYVGLKGDRHVGCDGNPFDVTGIKRADKWLEDHHNWNVRDAVKFEDRIGNLESAIASGNAGADCQGHYYLMELIEKQTERVKALEARLDYVDKWKAEHDLKHRYAGPCDYEERMTRGEIEKIPLLDAAEMALWVWPNDDAKGHYHKELEIVIEATKKRWAECESQGGHWEWMEANGKDFRNAYCPECGKPLAEEA